jgi:D-tyrosyl-tRNA(Tyr) deacylase
MRAVVQRVKEAAVIVDGRETGRIGPGMVVLLGIGKDDGEDAVSFLAEKLVGLRIFEDETSAMNRSITEVDGEILLVSQFTLYGDCRKGRRPSFDGAAGIAGIPPARGGLRGEDGCHPGERRPRDVASR